MAQDSLAREQQLELDNLLRQANVQRMRGQWRDAETSCRNALVISPNDVGANDMLVDILIELGKTDDAITQVKAAMALTPGNAKLETKYAKLVLEKGELNYQTALAQDMLEHPHKYTGGYARKPWLAVLLAMVFPGLGQLYNQELVKAGILASTFIVLMLFYVFFQPKYPSSISSMNDFIRMTNPVVMVLGIICLAAYVYGIVDALVVSGKNGADKSNPKNLLS